MKPTDHEQMIARAIRRRVSIDVVEKLLAYSTKLRQENARESFYRALARFQAQCPTIPRTREVYDESGELAYSYAPLDTIVATVREWLAECGFSYTLGAGKQTRDTVEAVFVLHHIDGYSSVFPFTLPIHGDSRLSAPQNVASTLTYAKRYAFCNGTGIMTADLDNDANTQRRERAANRKADRKPSAGGSERPPSPAKKLEAREQIILDDITKLVEKYQPLPETREAIRTDLSKAKNFKDLEQIRRTWSEKLKNASGDVVALKQEIAHIMGNAVFTDEERKVVRDGVASVKTVQALDSILDVWKQRLAERTEAAATEPGTGEELDPGSVAG